MFILYFQGNTERKMWSWLRCQKSRTFMMKTLLSYILKAYAPVWFDIKKQTFCETWSGTLIKIYTDYTTFVWWFPKYRRSSDICSSDFVHTENLLLAHHGSGRHATHKGSWSTGQRDQYLRLQIENVTNKDILSFLETKQLPKFEFLKFLRHTRLRLLNELWTWRVNM